MFKITKQDIHHVDFSSLAKLPLVELEETCKQQKLHNYSSWLLPQLVAWFGTWQPNDCALAMVKHNCKTLHEQALYRLALVTRSRLIQNQISRPEYGQLTPLILLGLKRSRGIPYEHWRNIPNLNRILEPKLYSAVVDKEPVDINPTRLLELQNIGLTYKAGQPDEYKKPADRTYGLVKLQGTELGTRDPLEQMIICQTWLAHPQNRRETMILDTQNWDSMPKPLVDWQPVPQQVVKTTKSIHDELIFD